MTESAPIPPEQEELFNLTKKTYSEALKLLSDTLMEHSRTTNQTPTNAMQFAAIDGFMAAAGRVLAAMTVDTLQGSEIEEEQILQGSIGALFMFQKTLENIFIETLIKADMKGVDVSARLDQFEEDYRIEKAKAGP